MTNKAGAAMIDRWYKEIDAVTKDVQTSFGGLSEEQLNWKPDPDTWSIAQVIHHLIVTNESYAPILEAAHEGKLSLPFWAKIGFVTNFFGKLVLKGVQPDRSKKVKTFPIWEPATSNLPGDIVDQFTDHQSTLKHHIEKASDLLKKDIIIYSPANKNIVYKLSTAIEIIISHEKRHLEQAKEVYQQQKTKKG